MAISVNEKYLGRRGSEAGEDLEQFLTGEVVYVVRGTDDEQQAIAAVRDVAPTTRGEMVRGQIAAEPITGTDWEVSVEYAADDDGSGEYAFETSGGSQHITHSRETLRRYPDGAADHKGAIGVTADGVAGCDITVPVYRWSETHAIDDADVTDAYKGKLFRLTGKTNDAAFRGCAAGEALFLGAAGSRRADGTKWDITFHFAASPNQTGLTIGDFANITKGGWEYLWIAYEHDTDADTHTMVPKAVYVERVYDDGDFGDLGIGT